MFHDGCTAGPLSEWLNGMIRVCCDAHDLALDAYYDLPTFMAGNAEFFGCVAAVHPWLAPIVFAVVAGPIGLLLYWFGPKAKKL